MRPTSRAFASRRTEHRSAARILGRAEHRAGGLGSQRDATEQEHGQQYFLHLQPPEVNNRTFPVPDRGYSRSSRTLADDRSRQRPHTGIPSRHSPTSRRRVKISSVERASVVDGRRSDAVRRTPGNRKTAIFHPGHGVFTEVAYTCSKEERHAIDKESIGNSPLASAAHNPSPLFPHFRQLPGIELVCPALPRR
ncbi:hypothetical protein PF70_01193 [Pseudomonas asplenii]|nr:hypothetical protein PF70_01193 [Pseudomonas fuscovaginae]